MALRSGTRLVGFAIDGTAANPAAGHDRGEALGPVLATGWPLRQDDRCAPEFAHRDD